MVIRRNTTKLARARCWVIRARIFGRSHGPSLDPERVNVDVDGQLAVRMADKYPDAVQYWLYLIVTEEYWKRCWVIQELVVARRIQIRVGSVSMLWADFIQLINWYAERQGRHMEVERILQLDTLRHSKHYQGNKFSLTRLVDIFQDSFCSNKLDKIFAFVGMADDCINGCLDIDYNTSPYDLYRNFLLFHNRGHHHLALDNRVSMIYTANLVRFVLSRESVLLPRSRRNPTFLEDTNSFSYLYCGEEWEQMCIQSNASDVILIGEILRRGISWIWSIDQPPPTRLVAEWLPPSPKSVDRWLPATNRAVPSNDSVIIRGSIAGAVSLIGPGFMDYLVLDKSSEEWRQQIDNHYKNKFSQKRVRQLGHLTTHLLKASAGFLLHRLKVLKFGTYDGDWDNNKQPRLFVTQNGNIGVISSNAKEGDLICQFWQSSVAAVLRRNGLDEQLQVIGRAVIARHPDYLG
ncbi:het domain protein [Fusarium beomiforme]|uniref:Het domain protein n=1 Tax=Fusarium beomiforme TaxID=44412 RepID=A0A9P5A5J1_9HYPO|nr:het domain protein [Fusarium beomiforme]